MLGCPSMRICLLVVSGLGLMLFSCGSKTGLKVGQCDQDAGSCCEPRSEVCNGLDDDCDGVIDDGTACFTLDGRAIEPVPTSRCGSSWYSYDSPDSESANPSPDIRRSGEVVVAIVAGKQCGGAHISVIADLPQDGSGGRLEADFRITPPGAGGLVVSDEPGECIHQPASGVGRCDWVWQSCCTDGVLLGAFKQDACVSLSLGSPVGVSKLSVLDGSNGAVPQAFNTPFEICSRIRPAVP